MTRASVFLVSFGFISVLILLSPGSECHKRYPFVLPKCCTSQENKAGSSRGFRGNATGCEGSEVVYLPNEMFPSMGTDLEDVEVELRYVVDGLHCRDSVEDLIINLKDVSKAVSYIGKRRVFKEVSFSGGDLVAQDGKLHSSYCISSVNRLSTLTIKMCKQVCSIPTPCVHRCCGGHQSSLMLTPTHGDIEDFCTTPINVENDWTPSASRILQLRERGPNFIYTMRPKESTGKCKALQLREDLLEGKKPLSLLDNGHLLLHLEERNIEETSFCIDGIFRGNHSDPSEIPVYGEVVVVLVCEPLPSEEDLESGSVWNYSNGSAEIQENSFPSLIPEEIPAVILPKCSFSSIKPGSVYRLPSGMFPDVIDEYRGRIPVKLENSRGLECHTGFKDHTTEFLFSGNSISLKVQNNSVLRFEGFTFEPNEYCLHSIFHNSISVRTCVKNCSDKYPCVHRCCWNKQHIDFQMFLDNQWTCEDPKVSAGVDWSPQWYLNVEDTSPLRNTPDVAVWVNEEMSNDCHFFTPNRNENHLNTLKAAPYKLLRTGQLMRKVGRKDWVEVESYCMEPFMRRGNDGNLFVSGNPEDLIIRECSGLRHKKEYVDTMPELVASFYFFFSSFYLGIAVLYILRKDKEPVFRWSIICCYLSMTLTYIMTGYIRISFHFHVTQTHYFTTCAFIAIFYNFMFLHGFSWMSVLCFDIWFSLTVRTHPGNKSMKRLVCYSVFAFMLPFSVVGTGVALDIIYPNALYTDLVVPSYGRERCLFGAGDAALPYLYAPLSVLISLNFLLFFGCLIRLRRSHKTMGDSKNETNRESLLYLKMFLLMGLPWLLEIAGWVVTKLDEPVPWWAVIVEIVTLVQPAFVFFFLVWTNETKSYIQSKYSWGKGVVECLDGVGGILRSGCRKEADGSRGMQSSNGGTSGTPVASI